MIIAKIRTPRLLSARRLVFLQQSQGSAPLLRQQINQGGCFYYILSKSGSRAVAKKEQFCYINQMLGYPFAEIEQRWQHYWQDNNTFAVHEDPQVPVDKRSYVLDMFPYPSASGLHVGHPEGYTASDIYSRWLRMQGHQVLHPMGFDAFGLPAENFALQTGVHPAKSTADNINKIRRQIKSLGFAYDWSREIRTCDPDYYRWTQWLFLQLYHRGLAYQDNQPINWCQSCLTGLANEEVVNGCCERCGSSVARRELRQWMLRITAYAQRLLDDLEDLDWPESVKMMQRNWIGRSEGAEIVFPLVNAAGQKIVDKSGKELTLTVFTTRPDTLFGATYMVVAPEHPLLDYLVTTEQRQQAADYCQQAATKSDLQRGEINKTKTGLFSGSYAINPVNNEKIPLWVADYVLLSYGSGAIMAVPAHDQRDWEFAQTFNLPIRQVISGGDVGSSAYTGDGAHCNLDFLNGLDNRSASNKMCNWLVENNIGKVTVNYRLRDWIFSRQRYWGEPIPVVHCQSCGVQPLAEEQLPLLLPEVDSYQPSGSGESPLARLEQWLNCRCPACNGPAKRETNTMPQWAGSCWYYLRYLDPHNSDCFVDRDKERYWMPVDLYIGGAEHAVLHLLYARFWHKVFFDLGLVSQHEPFQRLINQGMILGEMEFTAFTDGEQAVSASQVDYDQQQNPYYINAQRQRQPLQLKKLLPAEVEKSGNDYTLKGHPDVIVRGKSDKMSKSRGNVLNPDELICQYGADSFRMYEMFMGPLTMAKPWSTGGLAGVHRFLNRIWSIGQQPLNHDPVAPLLEQELHITIRKVSQDNQKLSFNTAIAAMMSFVNLLPRDVCLVKLWHPFVRLLAPFTPHLAEELWQNLGEQPSVANADWPNWDEALCQRQQLEIVFQVNGKLRSKEIVEAGLPRKDLLELAYANQKLQAWLAGKKIVKEIVVPDRLVNLVVQ